MDYPSELSLEEIRKFMLENGCKVTNHALVKHFKRFLTNPETQNESRKQFKTFVNTLATIKTENDQKYLILRKKYVNECPTINSLVGQTTEPPLSPGGFSITESCSSPIRQPPPYKPPPNVSAAVQKETKENYRDCVNEFQTAVNKMHSNQSVSNTNNSTTSSENVNTKIDNDNSLVQLSSSVPVPSKIPDHPDADKVIREKMLNDDKENIEITNENDNECENSVNVKEAARKFNRLASEEEAKVLSPSNKKKVEKTSNEEKIPSEVTMAHPKAKEWIISAAKANYQELAKLAQEYPELVKLQDPTATALHWAAKHGNEDVVKLIAGTYKANVDARTGYTPLHIAMQFGRDNIFELLCNVYKANRDLLDWSGNKPLDYRKQQTTVSASTYSKIRERRKHSEKDLGFLRIGSLNVRVRKTTEAFSNFLGVGGTTTSTNSNYHHHQNQNLRHTGINKMNSITKMNNHHHNHHHHHHNHHLHHRNTVTTNSSRSSIQVTKKNHHDFDKIHKSWGSADNIPNDRSNNCSMMPPPSSTSSSSSSIKSSKKGKSKNSNNYSCNSIGYSSMPTTPNQIRAPIGILSSNNNDNSDSASNDVAVIDSDSDSACGFGSNWSMEKSNNTEQKPPTYI